MRRTPERLRLAGLLVATGLIAVLSMGTVAQAEALPYPGYTYDSWGRSVDAPAGYAPERVLSGEEIGVGPLKDPADLFTASDGKLYLLDSGNQRIVVLDEDLQLVRTIDRFFLQDGSETTLANASGLFVAENGEICIADTDNERVLVTDPDGRVLRTYGRPDSAAIPKEQGFKPLKLCRDDSGYLYVYAYGVYQGLICYSPDGSFEGFFGANRVEVTADLLLRSFWKSIMTREQREDMARFVPIEISNLFIDSENFIYVSTLGNTKNGITVGELAKLNPLGINILRYNQEESFRSGGAMYPKNNFGDVESASYKAKYLDSRIVDVHTDASGIITALDQFRGKIFQYDSEGNPLFIFGGTGDQAGLFTLAVSLEKVGDNYVVLDSQKGILTEFRPTEYALLLRRAIVEYDEGKYVESMDLWREVLRWNRMSEIAYRSLGKGYLQLHDPLRAMEYLRLGNDHANYSTAFMEYRKEYVRKNILWLLPVLVAGIYLFARLVGFLRHLLGIRTKRRRIRFT